MMANCFEIPDRIPLSGKSFDDFPRKIYSDPEENYAAIVMYSAYDYGILNGYPHTDTLRPHDLINYAEASKIMFNALNMDKEDYHPQFTFLPHNVVGNEWHWKYMIYLIDILDDQTINPRLYVVMDQAKEILAEMYMNNSDVGRGIVVEFSE